MTLKINAEEGVVTIEGPRIAYGHIRAMHQDRDGQGLQVGQELEGSREEIATMCENIAIAIHRLDDVVKEGGE